MTSTTFWDDRDKIAVNRGTDNLPILGYPDGSQNKRLREAVSGAKLEKRTIPPICFPKNGVSRSASDAQ